MQYHTLGHPTWKNQKRILQFFGNSQDIDGLGRKIQALRRFEAWEGTTAMAGDFHSGLQRHAVLEKLHRSKSTKAGLYMELYRREMKTLKDFINNTCKKIKCLF